MKNKKSVSAIQVTKIVDDVLNNRLGASSAKTRQYSISISEQALRDMLTDAIRAVTTGPSEESVFETRPGQHVPFYVADVNIERMAAECSAIGVSMARLLALALDSYFNNKKKR